MSETPIHPAPPGAPIAGAGPAPAPRPGPTPGAVPASPGDPVAAATAAIERAVDALEASRAGSLDDQLATAEAVHAVLAEHVSGGASRP